ncbi:hypothetical protein BDW75DRAFT_56866 [Aspergillus navahoensis]
MLICRRILLDLVPTVKRGYSKIPNNENEIPSTHVLGDDESGYHHAGGLCGPGAHREVVACACRVGWVEDGEELGEKEMGGEFDLSVSLLRFETVLFGPGVQC